MFSLTTFQGKGQNHRLGHLIVMQKDINLDLDKRIQISSFRETRIGK